MPEAPANTSFVEVPSMTFMRANKSFPGSHKGMRWRIYIENDSMKAAVWPNPYSFEHTQKGKITFASSSLDDAGFNDAKRWVEEQYYSDTPRWEKSNQNQAPWREE